jgi:hypothetical protein
MSCDITQLLGLEARPRYRFKRFVRADNHRYLVANPLLANRFELPRLTDSVEKLLFAAPTLLQSNDNATDSRRGTVR